MQIVSVTFPKKIVVTVAVTAKHVVSADLTEILLDLDAINGEIIGTTAAEKTDKIEATKLAIKTVIETAGVDVPALTVFADYADYVNSAIELGYIGFNATQKSIVSYNGEQGSTSLVIPSQIRGVDVEVISDVALCRQLLTDRKLIALTLPATVKTLKQQCFRDNNIATLTIEVGSVLAYVGNLAFYGNKLTTLRLPVTTTTIINQAFQGCPLVDVEIPGAVAIGAEAFYNALIIRFVLAANATITPGYQNKTMGEYGEALEILYNSNGKLAGTYEYAAGSWSKTA